MDVAGIETPENLDVDGVSLAPLFHDNPRQKDHIYCWYHRNGVRDEATQHTRDQRYKLYATGAFFDTVVDPGETNNLAEDAVPESLTARHAKLKSALDRHVAVTNAADARQRARQERHKKSAR